MARDSYSLNLYQMVKVYQDLTIAPVSSAKYFILGILKNRKPALYKLFEDKITQGLNAPRKNVVKFANNLVNPKDKRHVPNMNHRRI